MATVLDSEMVQELYRRRDTFPLDTDVLGRISPLTLGEEALRFLGMLIVWKQPQHIVEFGSGLSTLFLARLQQRLCVTSNPPIVSINHSQRLLGETRRSIPGDPMVHFVHAPLAVTEYAGRVFTTYHPAYTRSLPSDVLFDFVLIDGPPAYRYGREAPLYYLAPRLRPDAVIVLNDANREPGKEALRNWGRKWAGGFAVEHFPDLQKGFAVLCIGDPHHVVLSVAPDGADGIGHSLHAAAGGTP